MSKSSPPNDGPSAKKGRISTTSHPFGNPFYARLAKILLHGGPDALEELGKCCDEVAEYKKAHPGENLADSGDEIGDPIPKSSMAAKKLFAGASSDRLRQKANEPIPGERSLKKAQITRSAGNLPETKDESSRSADSDESDNEVETDDRKCVSCSMTRTSSSDQLLQCHGCKEFMHMKCNRPEISRDQSRDPRFHFICSQCMAQEYKAERKSSNDPPKSESPKVQKTYPSSNPARPAVDFNQKLAEFKAKKNLGNKVPSSMLLKK